MNELLDAVYKAINGGDPAGDLRQVDRYIALYHKAPKRFVLPRKHAHLKPLIAAYANDLGLFLTTARRIRDTIKDAQGETVAYRQMQEFCRVLVIRLKQQERRSRASRMNEWMVEHWPELSAAQRQDWIRQIETGWMNRRRALLDEARRAEGGVLPVELSEELLEMFWEQVEQQITAGDFPPFKEDI